jgi:hypothetical protein
MEVCLLAFWIIGSESRAGEAREGLLHSEYAEEEEEEVNGTCLV